MRAKQAWTIQSLVSCVVFNGLTVAVFFYGAKQVLHGMQQWVDPFVKTNVTGISEEAQSAFTSLNRILVDTGDHLAAVLFGTAAVATLLLWIFLLLRGRSFAQRALIEAPASPSRATPPSSESPKPPEREKRAEKKKIMEVSPAPEPQGPPSPQQAVQILSILQREGRLIDFLQEDLSLYEDAQIGAAVRSIHQGCRQVLSEYMELKPVLEESEGTDVTVPAGFDARAIRLTGNVSGTPPFKGSLRHRGWRVIRMQLPQSSSPPQKKDWILAPAEVEVEG